MMIPGYLFSRGIRLVSYRPSPERTFTAQDGSIKIRLYAAYYMQTAAIYQKQLDILRQFINNDLILRQIIDNNLIYCDNMLRINAHITCCHSAVPFFGMKSLLISVFSSSSSAALREIPPLYPVKLPLVPTTRWQGIIIEIGLCPTAPPTA